MGVAARVGWTEFGFPACLKICQCSVASLLSAQPRMRITGLALVPPPTAADLPRVTPELLASVLARYSRSNKGLAAILEKVDLANPDASIDRILNFVDYGHASIGGLTGGLAIAVDDVSMWLAYKIFEIATMADGQESSTRYITMDASNLPSPEELGIPADLVPRWHAVMAKAFAAYHTEYSRLDALAVAQPNLVRLPPDAKPAVVTRLRKNYALDRARYFIPLATRTNLGLVQSSRMWASTVKHLDSLSHPEARLAAKLIRDELLKQSPRLMRHSVAEKSFAEQATQELAASCRLGLARLSAAPLADEVWVHVDRAAPPWLPEAQPVPEALRHRANRYGYHGTATRRMRVSFAWNNMAIAELRDLNRHRTGHRHTPLIQAGFYLPPEIRHANHQALLTEQLELTRELMQRGSAAYVYSLLLGAQTPFEHSTHADKFIYEAELRTGMGAHFRYAEHLSATLRAFLAQVPEARDWVVEGTAEPE
jgi:thymidylate synthase ThyX